MVRPLFNLLKEEIKLILTVLFCQVYQVLEKLVNNQLTGFLDVYSILSGMQSGFCLGYGCVTATLKVLNDVTIAHDSKQCYAAISIDLSKAFDTVDHSFLVGRLRSIGVSEVSLAWFANYLSQRVQYIKSENLLSQPLPVTKGVPQGLILGPTLNLNQHSSGSRNLSRPFICRRYSLKLSWPLPGFCVKWSTTKLS